MLYLAYQTDTLALVDSEEDGDCYFEVKVPRDVAVEIARGIIFALDSNHVNIAIGYAPYGDPLK